ncbi:MAG: hypothetical protein K2K94_10585 [Muribaculaceae bacterium]|nr:hypothetical protein [Muribaculaceae bacterium]
MEEREKIDELCRRVEETSGMRVEMAKDFERLAVKIYDRTGTLLSPTTLKRLWGYLKEGTQTRKSTMDFLAQYCGWHSYEEFLTGGRPEVESGFVDVKVLNAENDLRKGNVVKLMWHPSRVCEIKYLGNGRWKVIRSEGTRLAVGDTFTCSVIMSGEPLYIDNLMHEGVASGVYVCGRRNGVRFAIKQCTIHNA